MRESNSIALQSNFHSYSINSSYKKLEEWIFAGIMFILSTPVFIWDKTNIYTISSILFVLLSLSHFLKTNKRIPIIALLLIIIYSYFAIRYILLFEGSFFGFLLLILSFIPFVTLDHKFWAVVFEKYVTIFSITLIPSVIQHLLIYTLGMHFNYQLIEASPWNFRLNSYLNYGFCVQEYAGYDILPRFYGIYDEPGVIGTIAMVILFIKKYNLKKWYNVTIFTAGVLSFSFFFYIATIIYFFLFTSNKNRIVLVIIFAILTTFSISSEAFDTYFFDRINQVFSSGRFMENRENNSFNLFYKSLNNYDLIFGVPIGAKIVFSTVYKFLFVAVGIIPISIFFFLLFVYSYKTLRFSKELFIYILIPILVFAQRPFINNVFYIFLTIVPLHAIYIQKIKQTNEIKQKRYNKSI